MTRTNPGEEDEEEPLLADEEQSDEQAQPFAPNPYGGLPVYTSIHRVRHEVITSIDDPYSLEQLRAPRINVAIVRPLVNRLWDREDISIVYCLLVNKLQFLREQAFEAHQTINTTRALLCELVALKILRRFDEDNLGREGLLLLSNILVAGFEPFQNAPQQLARANTNVMHWTAQEKGGYERKSTVLEVAIISDSKMLLSSPACQKVMEAIYLGRVIYTPSSFIDILPDHYKYKPITLYHPNKAPLLNQYRLMVPRTRNILDICQFLVLLILYILTMQHRNDEHFTNWELIFCIYASGWVLDEFASILEHGWHCYTQNLWAFLDFMFIVIYSVYFILRIHSLAIGDSRSGQPALDILSAGAPVLIPRLAFNLLSENMLFVSSRAMMTDFTILTLLAVWCFAGFLLSMMWLAEGDHTPLTISKWMLWVWFGLDSTGIQRSVEFHWLIGPILMVTFAFLGNTLFLTILVSMLSSTFSKIANNATAEIQFRRAVMTFEGVKSDAIFAYQPPFNVLALCILLPLKTILTPRWFHKINVAAIRTINAPLLLIIGTYERRHLWKASKAKLNSRPSFWDFSRFSVRADIQAVFESDPPQSMLKEIIEAEDISGTLTSEEHHLNERSAAKATQPLSHLKKRKDSMVGVSGLAEHLSEYAHEYTSSDVAERLEALEKATKRIENMLRKRGQNFEDDAGRSDAGTHTSTIGIHAADDISEGEA